ncbi:gluconolaconase [Humibacillus sp. DSM 29435]|uniref:SMP-30/gluconolactonase/LRE family protein n=1 Tax=Humibacillus sp. DSM 29435 TaxID=1869167 RepID=UPI000873152B|nr:SMP-30/gluconolactonase/LRE family protein [Humibacillus sp. DSM 29435]OFE15429.1 gluconolaconase [Humibacillus sp. DSM 29435]
MKRTAIAIVATATLPFVVLPVAAEASVAPVSATTRTTPGPAASADRHGPLSTYRLTGDDGGSKFEGIGADQRTGLFYVSEVTGGEIHRGWALFGRTQEWLPGDGVDGRFTARGVTVDDAGRVYIAGGPNGIGTGRPDLWVYSQSGRLLAALRAPGDNVFLNDVAIGPDGAAYFTNSNTPQVFRVATGPIGWGVELWSDATGTIETTEGFNLGGVVVTADRRALVVAQGTTGDLWRFDLRTRAVSAVATGGADLTGADGLVREGNRLTVVRNFQRMIATLRLEPSGRSARLVRQQASDPQRVLTTAKTLWGRTLYVDSKFDEPVASGPYEVVTRPLAR